MDRFWSKVDRSRGPDACWLWTGSHIPSGYGKFHKDGKRVAAHRMAYEITNGPIPAGMCICHRCDNPTCVNPSHLFLATHADNMRDMWSKERRPRPFGTANPAGKLTTNMVREIRRLRRAGLSIRAIAKEVGPSKTTIHEVITGATWVGVT